MSAQTAGPDFESVLALALCARHQGDSPTRQPCAACSQDAEPIAAALRAEVGRWLDARAADLDRLGSDSAGDVCALAEEARRGSHAHKPPEHSHPTGGAWNVTRWAVPGCPACLDPTESADQ